MTTQTGATWLTGRNSPVVNGINAIVNPAAYISFTGGLGVVRYVTGLLFNNSSAGGTDIDFGTGGVHSNNNNGCGALITACINVTGTIASLRNNGTNASIGNQVNGSSSASVLGAHGNIAAGLTIWGIGRTVVYSAISAMNNATYGVMFRNEADELVIKSLITSGNSSGGIGDGAFGITLSSMQLGYQSTAYIKNANVSESVEVSPLWQYSNARIISENHDLTAGNTQIFTDGGRIASESTVVHTTPGLSWSFSPTSTSRASNYPLSQEIARIAVKANALVTASIWLRRTNTGLTMQLMCKGGQIAGVAADVSSAMTAGADTWEQRTITFTPTEIGVVSITVEAYGGTTFIGYADDFSASQG
jgi:hypothetical protein